MRSYVVEEIITDGNGLTKVLCNLRREKPTNKCFIKFVNSLTLISKQNKSVIRVYRIRNRPPYMRIILTLCEGVICSKYEN